ncbi:fimbrial protein [Kluyvera genomosp. 1]|uniref:fimbrial protein n=1 Tax=Kluyvera genomosp. 1 TaxID=2774053 RepID=UPI00068F98C4|nr:fimbrial protein [Kluyvera genomosp. 1]
MYWKTTLLALSLFTIGSSPTWADETNAGEIHFTGEIINPSCEISGDSGKNINVYLGSPAPSYFTKNNGKSDDVAVPITLIHCPVATDGLSKVQLTFTGTPVDTRTDMVALDAGGAEGVGITLSTEEDLDTYLDITGAEGQTYVDLPETADGTITTQVEARYVSISGTEEGVTPGAANAKVTVGILYR